MKILICIMISLASIMGAIPISVNDSNETLYYGAGYNGATFIGTDTETITYATKEETEYSINGGLPTYYDTSTRQKTCANVAGAIVLGYYDKTYDELIYDFTSARVIRDRVIYYAQTDAVQSVMDNLYDTMETNSTSSGGTSVAGFQNGLRTYVNGKGRNITYSGTGQNNQLNKSAYIQSVQNNRPIALFVSKYSLIPILDFSISNTQDKLEKKYFSGNHVLISYGIKEINYYNANGTLKKQLTLLMVATGFRQEPLYYIELDSNSGMIESYSVNIY